MRTLFFVLICFSIISCESYDCSPENFTFNLLKNKNSFITYDSISQEPSYRVKDGDGLIFEYAHTGAYCNNRKDDEWGEILRFEIPSDIDNFEYEDAELATINCVYKEYGAWVSHLPLEVTEGSIRGEKQVDGSWEVTMNVIAIRNTSQEETSIRFIEYFD